MIIISPLSVTLPRKRSAGKRIYLNMNWYRNVYFQTNNAAKAQYKLELLPQLAGARKLQWPVKINYRYFLRQKCDVANVHAVVEKFFLDVLVELGKLPDDSIQYVVGSCYIAAGIDRRNPRAEIEIIENYQPQETRSTK